MKNLRQLNETEIAQGDWLFRQRIESLQGVDEILEDVMQLLEDKQISGNTYSKFPQKGWRIKF